VEVTPENVRWIIGAIYTAFALPIIPLVLGWRALLKTRAPLPARIAHGLFTLSYVWVVAVIAGMPVIARHYTTARTIAVEFNIVALLIVSILVVIKHPAAWQVYVTGFSVCLLWWYLDVIGVVV
jgi:hypothetical protein